MYITYIYIYILYIYTLFSLERPPRWVLLSQPTTNPLTNRPLTTYSIIIFKRFVNRKIFILQNTRASEKMIFFYYLFDE